MLVIQVLQILLSNKNNLDEKLNTSGSAGSGDSFYFDYKDSQYGYNTSSARGADTFHPFKSGAQPIVKLGTGSTGGYTSTTITIQLSKVPEQYIVLIESASCSVKEIGSGAWESKGPISIGSYSLSGTTLTVTVAISGHKNHTNLYATVVVYGY